MSFQLLLSGATRPALPSTRLLSTAWSIRSPNNDPIASGSPVLAFSFVRPPHHLRNRTAKVNQKEPPPRLERRESLIGRRDRFLHLLRRRPRRLPVVDNHRQPLAGSPPLAAQQLRVCLRDVCLRDVREYPKRHLPVDRGLKLQQHDKIEPFFCFPRRMRSFFAVESGAWRQVAFHPAASGMARLPINEADLWRDDRHRRSGPREPAESSLHLHNTRLRAPARVPVAKLQTRMFA